MILKKIIVLNLLWMLLCSGISIATPLHKNGEQVKNIDGYTWSNASYWGITDSTAEYVGETTFELVLERASYESAFGLYTVDDVNSPTSISSVYEVFSLDDEPSRGITSSSVYFRKENSAWYVNDNASEDLSNWTVFDNEFGFYFGVDVWANGSINYTYYSDSNFNTVDKGDDHVAIQYDGAGNISVHLEDLRTRRADWDWEDMVVKGSNLSPVPEPDSLILLGAGLIGLAFIRRKMQDK